MLDSIRVQNRKDTLLHYHCLLFIEKENETWKKTMIKHAEHHKYT